NGDGRGLRVPGFGKQKIFCVHGPDRSDSRAERHRSCESSFCDSQHAHRSSDVAHDRLGIERPTEAAEATSRAPLTRANVRDRAWISADR
ncbi:hypothetical protein ABTB68_19140, partial [Acinetobacter baumannii]